jgi:hypothetical protein
MYVLEQCCTCSRQPLPTFSSAASVSFPSDLPVRQQLECNHLTPPAVVRRRAGNKGAKGYTLAKTIVHGLLVFIT